jgi:hypothetical protein
MVKIACIGAGYVGGVSSTAVWLQPTYRGHPSHLLKPKHVASMESQAKATEGPSWSQLHEPPKHTALLQQLLAQGTPSVALSVCAVLAAHHGHDRLEVPRD